MVFTHLYIELTSACNLNCPLCCVGTTPPAKLEGVDALLEKFSQTGGQYVTLSGGEPLLREDWVYIAEISTDLGMITTLFTNGTLIKQNMTSLTDCDLLIAISLDAVDKSINDLLRGPSYSRVMEAINLLVDAGKEKEMALSYTPSAVNCDQLEPVAEFAISKGIEHLHVSLMEFRGRAQQENIYELSEQQKINLMKTLYSLAREHEGVLFFELSEGTDLLYDPWHFGSHILENPLGKTLKITAQGAVYTSTFVEGDLFLLGRYPQQSLEELIHAPKIQLLSEQLRKRPHTIPQCARCIFNPVCCSGVYTLAYNRHGTIWVPDEFCAGNQAIFEEVLLSQVKS
ncbi:MAG: radical SAM protein [Theionarchaea archaeon]|nr:radical SAM protein [Theionarchaea archaeon]